MAEKSKTPKPIPEHRDKLGRLINIGDFVAFPDRNSLEVGVVKKLNPKMIGIGRMKSDGPRTSILKILFV
jgi:hypothetical protein